jgi:hypothetical protein
MKSNSFYSGSLENFAEWMNLRNRPELDADFESEQGERERRY